MKLHSIPTAVLIATVLSGCGVKEEEHLRVVEELANAQTQLNAAKSNVSELTGTLAEWKETVAELQGTLEAEKEKSSSLQTSLSEASKKGAELEARLKTENIVKLEATIEHLRTEKAALLKHKDSEISDYQTELTKAKSDLAATSQQLVEAQNKAETLQAQLAITQTKLSEALVRQRQ